MDFFSTRTNEETNFLKCSLLISHAIPKGIITLLTNNQDIKLESSQSYDFQKLCCLLTNQENLLNSKIQHSISKLSVVREDFFQYLSRHCIDDDEFEVLKEQLIEIFVGLELALDDINEICTKATFSEDEVLSAYEKLSQETRNFSYLGPEFCHKTIHRTTEVDAVLKQLDGLSRKNPKGNSTVFIDGGHGDGKSELAKQAADKLWRADHVNKLVAIMVLNAETEESLLLSYVNFAKQLLCNFGQVEMAVTSPGLLVAERLRLLKHIIGTQLKKYSYWLVVIDNVNHFESLSSYWPAHGSDEWGRGHIIVTLPDICNVDTSLLTSSGHVTLSCGMEPSDAVQLLCEVSNVKDKDCILEVAEVLQFQPLALACAAVFVRNLMKVDSPWKMYVELFNKYKKEMCENKENVTPNSYTDSCSTTIHMLLTQLQSQNREISDVEHLLNMFHPFSVKKETLANCLKRYIKDSKLDRLLQDLSPLLSTERRNGESESISLRHKLQASNHSGLEENQVSILSSATASLVPMLLGLENAKSVLNESVYNLSYRAAFLASEMSRLSDEQQKEFIDHLNGHTTGEVDTVDILLRLAEQCRLIQKLEQSVVLLTVAKDLVENEGGLPNSLRLALILNRLGTTLRDIGNKDAKKYLDKALDIYSQQKEVPYEKVAEVLTALGDVAIASEDISNAKAFYTKALETCSKHSNSMALALCWYKLANIHAIERSFQLAKAHYEKALTLMAGTNFVELAKVLTCLGAMTVCTEDYELARDYLEKAMTLEKRLYSKFHPCRLSSIKNAANASKALEDNDYAEKLLRESLEISQNVTCRFDAEVAQVFSQLGSLRAAQGDLKSAIECYSNALEIQKSTLPCQLDPVIADSCCELGHVYARNGELEMARSLHERALGIRGLVFQADHPDIGTSYFRLGKVYNTLGDNETALSMLERAVEIRGKVFGEQHHETLDSIYHLGNSFARLGRLHHAKNMYETVVEGQQKLTGYATALAKTTESLAEMNFSLGEINTAKEQFKRAIEMRRSETEVDSTGVARPLVRLALVHEHCKEMSEAKTLLEKALNIYRKSVCSIGRSHILVTETHLKRVLSKLPLKGCTIM